MLLQLTYHLLDEGRRHGKRDADIAAGGREDRGVHANDLAVQIEGRAARVAAVHRCIDLQIVIGARSDIAVMSGDDACSHRPAEAKRIADCEHPITDAGVLLREFHVWELLRSLDLEQGHIGARIGPDQGRGKFIAVLERHRNVLGVLNHVVVGDKVSVRRNKEARALRHGRMRVWHPVALAGLALAELLEEVVEGVVLGQIGQSRDLRVVVGDLRVALDVDADHRGAHPLHEIGKAQRRRPHRCLDGLRRRRGLRRLGGSKAHVLAEREPQSAYGNQRGRRYRKRPTRKLPRALLGHGALIRLIHKVSLSKDRRKSVLIRPSRDR